MDKPVRNAVKCYLIKDNNVVVTKYKAPNKKEEYYDIPGGKIEDGETPEQTAIREVKEETGMNVISLNHKGIMTVEYPNRIYSFEVFVSNEYSGNPKEFQENTSEWINIDDLLKKEKILSNIIILDRFFIKCLEENQNKFTMHINVDETENILGIEYSLT